jgi:hypothetical protein
MLLRSTHTIQKMKTSTSSFMLKEKLPLKLMLWMKCLGYTMPIALKLSELLKSINGKKKKSQVEKERRTDIIISKSGFLILLIQTISNTNKMDLQILQEMNGLVNLKISSTIKWSLVLWSFQTNKFKE